MGLKTDALPMERSCKSCGKKYIATSSGRLCPECKKVYDREKAREYNRRVNQITEHTVSCAGCGKEFSTAYNLKLYCSDECRRRVNEEKRRNSKKFQRFCEECGKEFYAGRNDMRFCSLSCSSTHAQRLKREARALEPPKPKASKPPKQTSYSKKCQWCGKEFEAKKAETRFCSPSCGMSWYRAEQAKSKPPKAEAKPKKKEHHWKVTVLPPVVKKEIKYGKPRSEIAKVEAAARAAGLSYGQFVAGYLAPQERTRRAEIEARRTELERMERERKRRIAELMQDIENLG